MNRKGAGASGDVFITRTHKTPTQILQHKYKNNLKKTQINTVLLKQKYSKNSEKTFTIYTYIQQKSTHINREMRQKLWTYKKDVEVLLTPGQIAENSHTQTYSKHQIDTKNC